jgi:hypothetical protein
MGVNGDYRWCNRELYEYCSTLPYNLDAYDTVVRSQVNTNTINLL